MTMLTQMMYNAGVYLFYETVKVITVRGTRNIIQQ